MLIFGKGVLVLRIDQHLVVRGLSDEGKPVGFQVAFDAEVD